MTIISWNRRTVLIGAFVSAFLVGSLAPSYAFLDKTRFAAHLGIAYFCFHHWVLKPYQDGAFATGAPHRTSALVKGGAALLFAIHEVKVSEKIAHESKDPLLQKVDGGVETMMASFGTIGQKLKSGQFDPKDIEALKESTSAVATQAAADGATIKDVPVPLPGS